MSKAAYIGVGGVAHKVKKIYIGVDGVARKVKKAYVGVDGVAQLFYTADVFNYTGEWSATRNIEIDSTIYDLYTLTSSGTLTLGDDAQYWMCGGGETGDTTGHATSQGIIGVEGGRGGFGGHFTSGGVAAGVYAVVIGAGGTRDSAGANGGSTTIGSDHIAEGGGVSKTYNNQTVYGASGGGAGGRIVEGAVNTSGGLAAYGTSTVPFGILDLKKHCAGGGGGGVRYTDYDGTTTVYNNGGSGGSNGSRGSSNSTTLNSSLSAANGGEYGGGSGASVNSNGTAGSFYGAGGGGASGSISAAAPSSSSRLRNQGAGYQGVCYILVEVGKNTVPITITLQPVDVVVTAGTRTQFKVEATGNNLTYQWEYLVPGTANWKNNTWSGNATPTLAVTPQTYHNGYKYRCRITDGNGYTVYSDEVTLTVTDA